MNEKIILEQHMDLLQIFIKQVELNISKNNKNAQNNKKIIKIIKTSLKKIMVQIST